MATSLDTVKESIQRALRRAEAGEVCLAIPPPCEIGKRIKSMDFHPFPELYFPHAEDLTLRLPQGTPIPLSPEKFGLLAALQPHADDVPGPAQARFCCCIVRFRPNNTLFVIGRHVTLNTLSSHKVAVQSSPLSALATETANRLIKLRHTPLHERGSIEHGLLVHLLALLLNLLDDAHAHEAKLPNHPKLLRAHRIALQQVYDPSFTIQHLAQRVGLSADHLSALYRQEFGKPMSAFLTQLRLNRAKELLKYSDLNMSEVGYASGYRYPAYFTKVFRQHVGMPPTAFRESAAKIEEDE